MKRIFALLIAWLSGSLGALLQAAPGDLDPTFGSGGKVTTAIGSGGEIGESVAVQSDGKIVVAGVGVSGSNGDLALIRYNADGTLDTNFGSGGKVITDFRGGSDYGHSVALQGDGKILVAGSCWNGGSNHDFALARYNTDGTLDSSFGSGGKVITGFGSDTESSRSMALQGDGKIVLAGYTIASSWDFALARYHTDGTLDGSFGSDGKVITDVGSGTDDYDTAYSMALQGDGRILVAGASFSGGYFDFALARYNADGTLDTNFGSGGKVITDFTSGNDHGFSVTVQNDGKIVATGCSSNGSNYDFALARYTSTGALDPAFGSGGKVTTSIGTSNDYGRSVALQGDGKIIVAGYTQTGIQVGINDFALVRFNADGTLDNGFGSGGKMTTDFDTMDYGYSVTLQADGKIVLAGVSRIGGNDDFALARYEGGPFSSLESWRLQHFNIVNNTGNAADTFDFDGDGLPNLAEYALGLVPTSGASCQLPQGQRVGNDFVIGFVTPAGVSGIIYGAEWSTTLAPNSWTAIPNTGAAPQNVFSVPIGSNAQLFLRLKVSNP